MITPSACEDRRVQVGAVSLRVLVREGATGEVPFVLVHGLASNAHMWDGVGEALGVSGHSSAAVDQRGHGRSDKPDDGYDFATVTDDLAALIGALGYRRPVVVGQSWGGNVVLELAWRFPDLVAGIACIDGGTIELARVFPDWEACRAALTPPRTVGLPAVDIESFMRRSHPEWPASGIAGSMANFEVRSDGTVAPWLTVERHLLILRSLWEHRPSTRYEALRVPVLLVPATGGGGPQERAKQAAIATASALIPNVRVHAIRGDHDLHAQFPAEIAALLHQQVVEGFFA